MSFKNHICFVQLMVSTYMLSTIGVSLDTLALFGISNCPAEFKAHCDNARINVIRLRLANEISKYPTNNV